VQQQQQPWRADRHSPQAIWLGATRSGHQISGWQFSAGLANR
jgi:hypothetical protein